MIREAIKPAGYIALLNGNVVVKGTEADIAGVAKLLEAIRETRRHRIDTEAIMVLVPETALAEFKADWVTVKPVEIRSLSDQLFTLVSPATQSASAPSQADRKRLVYLSDPQVGALRKIIDDTGDATMVSLPRISANNGQRAWAIVGEPSGKAAGAEKVGAAITKQGCIVVVEGTISANRQYITLGMHPTLWNPQPGGKPDTLDTRATVVIPDRGTIAIDMGTIKGPLRLAGIKDAAGRDAVR